MSKREIPRKFQHPLTFFELLSEGLQRRGSLRFYGSTVLRFIFTVRFGGVSVLKRGAEGLVEVLRIFRNEGVSWEAGSTYDNVEVQFSSRVSLAELRTSV